MGRNNRTRRSAKAKKRQEEAARRRQRLQTGAGSTRQAAGDLLNAALFAGRAGRPDTSEELLAAALLDLASGDVAEELGRFLERSVAAAWENGWQPADVMRLAGRELGSAEIELLRAAVASEAATYEQWGWAAAPAWMAQLDAMEARRWWLDGQQWVVRIGAAWHDTVKAAVRLLTFLDALPSLPRLMPPPSSWPRLEPPRPVRSTGLDPAILAKIRALLAKAESTEYDAEAESFTAKAQELMTRHRIDRATLSEEGSSHGEVVGRRVGVDNPYADTKAMLLGGIASANACRAVWSKALGFATIFGVPEDLDGVEELYTSLLLQAGAALRREGSKIDRYGRSRTARFRRSFMVGFAAGVSHRLRDAADDTVRRAESETGVALVPLLDARDRAAEDAMHATMSGLKGMSVSVSDGEGYLKGQKAADEADLSADATPELASAATRRDQASGP